MNKETKCVGKTSFLVNLRLMYYVLCILNLDTSKLPFPLYIFRKHTHTHKEKETEREKHTHMYTHNMLTYTIRIVKEERHVVRTNRKQ